MLETTKPNGLAAKYVPALFEALKLWSLTFEWNILIWFLLQRRTPLESTIKCSFRPFDWVPVLIMLDYCLLGNIPEEICDFPILNWESNKAAVGVWQLAEKQVWGPDTALRPPCLETPTLHIFYITTVIHIWFDIFIRNLSCWQWSCYNQ